jgi:hypothetical protein
MSMSTGDVRRPSTNKETKATAADDKKPESGKSGTGKSTNPSGTAGTGKTATGKGATASGKGTTATGKGTTATGKGTTATGKGASGTAGGRSAAKTAASAKAVAAAKGASGTRTDTGGGRTGGTRPGGRPGAGGGGKGRKPITPVKVAHGRNWGPILMFAAAGLVSVLIIGFMTFQLIKKSNQPGWQDRAADIDGISTYLTSNPEWFNFPEGNHKPGPLTYPMNPPAGGIHNDRWQNCMGDVYAAEIPKEHAVHSLEHGAVWVTYRPDLPPAQVEELAAKVRDRPFMMMSPYPGLDKPISLQAWGYQLKVDDAGDGRVDEFINALRQNATQEPQVGCSEGLTQTGTVPLDPPAQQG